MSARRTRLAAASATAVLLPLLGAGVAGAAPDAAPVAGAAGIGDPYYPTYGNGGYDVQHYDLAVRYDPATDRLAGRARIDLRTTQALSSFHLDLVGLTVRAVTVGGAPATWVRRGGHELVVRPARALARGAAVTVDVRYDGVPRSFTDGSGETYGFLTTRDGAVAIGEPEAAAQWFPVDDHPSDKATYRLALTVPKGLETISNGLDTRRTVDGDWATTTWEPAAPMAPYLAFFAIGHFDVHRWRTAAGLPVIDAVDSRIQGPLRARIDATFARQGEVLAAEASWFGPYPFETAGGVVDADAVDYALENQTRPTYPAYVWEDPQSPTQGTDVVVHELAHQWYGDSVSLDRWSDIWLNEGFATYAEWLWNEREFGYTPQEQFDVFYAEPASSDSWTTTPQDPGVADLFSSAVYVRGAMTLQALRATVGDAVFFDVLRSWAGTRRDGNGTTAQFVALAERKAGRPLDALFRAWLSTPRKPGPLPTAATTPARSAEVTGAVQAWRAALDRRLTREAAATQR